MTRLRRIVHLVSTPAGIGGAEKVVVALAAAAESRGWETTVLDPFDEDPAGSALARALPPQSYQAARFPHWDLIRARTWCNARIRELEPTLIHAHMAHAGLLGASLRVSMPRLFSHQHGDYFRAHRMRIRAVADRWATRRFGHVVAVSSYVHRFLVDAYGIDPRRLTTIPNGWAGCPLPRDPPSRPTVIAVSNLRRGKGHEILVEAFAKVTSKLPNAELVVVGDGPLRSQIEGRAHEALPRGSVRFEGAIEDVWPVLSRAHVFALPSFTETAGIAAMEAMAAGLPVVASDVGGLPELILPDRTGLLVPPGDTEALANALTKVLSLPDQGRSWGEAGRTVVERFSTARMIDAYYELYETLADAREKAPDD